MDDSLNQGEINILYIVNNVTRLITVASARYAYLFAIKASSDVALPDVALGLSVVVQTPYKTYNAYAVAAS